MKKLVLIAALAAVSACSKPAPEADPTAAPSASESVASNIAADGKSSVGKFKVTLGDGKVILEDVKADGTYTGTIDGKQVESGKWSQKNPNLYCFTEDKKDAVEQCNEEKVENGVWTSKNAKGEVAKVERVED